MILAPTPLTTPSQQKTLDFRTKYKTQKCRYWIQKGYCPYSSSCTFAHSELQVRSKIHIPQNYKTKICINFSTKGYCLYGDRCQYLHLIAEQVQKQQDGRQTRSNSEQSNSSRSSRNQHNSNQLWPALSYNKKVELIQTLGLDMAVRSSSRLMQILNSNDNFSENSPQNDEKYIFGSKIEQIRKDKKYSM